MKKHQTTDALCCMAHSKKKKKEYTYKTFYIYTIVNKFFFVILAVGLKLQNNLQRQTPISFANWEKHKTNAERSEEENCASLFILNGENTENERYIDYRKNPGLQCRKETKLIKPFSFKFIFFS